MFINQFFYKVTIYKMSLNVNKNDYFKDSPPKNINLSDTVIAYFDGIKWKIIPLYIMLQHSIIHDVYIDPNSVNSINISVYVCPNTLFSCVYFDKFELHNKLHCDNVSVINNENNYVIIPITNTMYSTITNKTINNFIRKGEVKILTYKNIMYLFPDSLFFDVDMVDKKKMIVIREN